MNRDEKKVKRDYIGKHLDISKSRLKDDEVDLLCSFIDEYDDKYKGQSSTKKSSFTGWSSDGKYTRWEETTTTYGDDIAIHEEYSYHDDDGQRGGHTNIIKDARGILNRLKKG